MNTPETKLLYLNDSYLFEETATLLAIQETEDGRKSLILDQTIFYPQGGGQPCDQGEISNEAASFKVQDVRYIDGNAHHIGDFTGNAFTEGEEVLLAINPERRKLNTRIHSTGHLLDVAMFNLGYTFPPTKGYHFPDSPYVEYDGIIEPENRPEAKEKLNAEVKRLISEGEEVKTVVVDSKDALKEYCEFIPDYLPEGKPIRVVIIARGFGCPCGGTQVKNVSELGAVNIHKIKVKNGKTRVSYKLSD